MKKCTKCGEEKAAEGFYRLAASADGRGHRCKSCMSAYSKAWYACNADRSSEYHKRRGQLPASRVLRSATRHGLTVEKYTALGARGCGVCGGATDIEAAGGRAHIDHDHSCCPGKYSCGECVRAILCRHCNLMLGMAKDNPATLRAAADYLERHATREMAA